MDTNEEEALKTAKFNHTNLLKYLQDTKGSLPDPQTEPFLNTMTELVKIFNVIGSAISFAFKDITSKVGIIRNNRQVFPEIQGGLISFIENEKQLKLQRLNGENPKEAPEAKYKTYTSTTRTLLRLMWFLDFLNTLINYMVTERSMKVSDCCKKAYEESLGPHHPFAVRMAAKTAMSFAPTRDKFMKELFPEGMTDEDKYNAFKQCLETMAPVREFLWKYYQENDLTTLP